MRRLDVEEWREKRLQNPPLIESQAVDNHEHGRPVPLQNRKQKFADDIYRKRRTISLEMLEPRWIFRLHVSSELTMHVGIQTAKRIVEPHLASGCEIDVPSHQLVKAID